MKNDNNKNLSIKLAIIIQQITLFLIILLIPHYSNNIPLIVALIINNISTLLLLLSMLFAKNNISKYNILSIIINFVVLCILFIYVATLTRPLSPEVMNKTALTSEAQIINQTL